MFLFILALTTCARQKAFDAASTYAQAGQLERRGDLKQALALADEGLSRLSNQSSSEWYWKFLLLKAEVLLTQGNTPDAFVLLQGTAQGMPDIPELQCRLLLDQGRAEFGLSHFSKSQDLLNESLQIAESHGFNSLIVEIEFRRGAAEVRMGDADAGESDFRDALQRARQSGDAFLEASALGNLGFLCMNTARYDEAVSWLNKSLVAYAPFQSKSATARGLNNLGQCYFELGKLEQAAPLFQRAESLAAEIGDLTDRQTSLGRIGDTYQYQGDYKTAIIYYERALSVGRQINNKFWIANWLHNLTTASIELGDLSRADGYNREALHLQADVGDPVERLWPEIDQARIAEARGQIGAAVVLYRSVIRSAEALSAVKEPGLVLEARGRLASLLAETHQQAEADAEFLSGLKLIDGTRSGLNEDEYRISYFASLVYFYQQYVDFLVTQHREIDALRIVESSRARVLTERLGDANSGRALSPRGDYRKLARTSNTTLLSYWLAPRRSFLWVITAQKESMFELAPQAEIERLSAAYGAEINRLGDPIHGDNNTGRKLYDALLAPAAEFIAPGSRIAIVPDGGLHELNFETLPAGGAPSRYWIEDVTISIAPSLDILAGRASQRASRVGSILLIGDPLPPDDRNFPRLPNAESEINGIKESFHGAVLRTGAAAEPRAYVDSTPARFSMIHFAAHAEANPSDPLDSAIILSPDGDTYKLYARDIVRTPLRAKLVTLSACRSAGSRAYWGEGLMGFAWAFLEAGAQNVVAGSWEVDDRSTAELMTAMYSELGRGRNPSEALRAAKLRMCHQDGPYRKPYYWGAFQIMSDALP